MWDRPPSPGRPERCSGLCILDTEYWKLGTGYSLLITTSSGNPASLHPRIPPSIEITFV